MWRTLLSAVLAFCMIAAPSRGADEFLISYWWGPEPNAKYKQVQKINGELKRIGPTETPRPGKPRVP